MITAASHKHSASLLFSKLANSLLQSTYQNQKTAPDWNVLLENGSEWTKWAKKENY